MAVLEFILEFIKKFLWYVPWGIGMATIFAVIAGVAFKKKSDDINDNDYVEDDGYEDE